MKTFWLKELCQLTPPGPCTKMNIIIFEEHFVFGTFLTYDNLLLLMAKGQQSFSFKRLKNDSKVLLLMFSQAFQMTSLVKLELLRKTCKHKIM